MNMEEFLDAIVEFGGMGTAGIAALRTAINEKISEDEDEEAWNMLLEGLELLASLHDQLEDAEILSEDDDE
jgi:hypothetical protein